MKPMPLANSLAITSALAWIVCSIFIWILPDLTLYATRTQMMGMMGVSPTGFSLDFQTFLAGGIIFVIIMWLFGFVWGTLYQKFDK